ncbi:glycosyl hydrolase 2 galactose-binding domain-containing protein [Pengzhenrongella sicca]|uniref:beta-mannosidase n=1 Tax=Pengzhenrongella sicca TaxID=2819238 RepID=A0A8A4ZCU6_9MICO|nr:glycoside hydrolase family 2 protein [Pengzhenrongella sicca]QTE29185.1 glycoside hydrolase family 2 protein [Pengzhenrongella sicca]
MAADPTVAGATWSWTVRCLEPAPGAPAAVVGLDLPATVPGHVHSDLVRAGILADPYVGDGEAAQDWVGRSRWRYSCDVECAPSDRGRTDLVFEGLDTFATVEVNGREVGRADDQHVAYRWDVSDVLRPGANRIEVTFDSAFEAADALEQQVGRLPRPYPDPYPFVRKMACNFGWDWGPRLPSVGIWRPARLEAWGPARIVGVRPVTSFAGAAHAPTSAVVRVHVDLNLSAASGSAGSAGKVLARAVLRDPAGAVVAAGEVVVAPVLAPGSAPGSGFAGTTDVRLSFDGPELWWPVGLGAQPLYTLETSLLEAGRLVAIDRRRIGLRRVEVDETPDARGTCWALRVNGRRVRVRGYNWIPDLPLPNDVTAERLAERLDQAVTGGANLLRVWGGGHFAFDEFLDGCDERGLLVWHDFLFACAAYSEDAHTEALVRAEAEQAVTRMASHPSVVLWCGGNECVWGWRDWDWQDTLAGRAWGATYYTRILPEIVGRLAPSTPYLPNSPWSGTLARDPEDQAAGPVHIWDVWNEVDWTGYRDWDPRFVSEMGWCAPATYATLRRAVPEGELLPGNPRLEHHMRAANGMENLARGIAAHFAAPVDGDDWLYLTQVTQARAMRAGVEWLRSREGCDGVIVWQLNDCWPSLSWAAVDVDGLPKPAWYALRDAFADRLLTLQPVTVGDHWGAQGVELVAVNDALTPWSLGARVRRMSVDGRELARAEVTLETAPDGTSRARLEGAVAAVGDPRAEFLVADADGLRSVWFFRPDRELAAPRPAMTTSVHVADGVTAVVRVTAQTLLRDLALFADRAALAAGVPAASVTVDRMLLTLLPGETAEFRVGGLSPEAVAAVQAALTRSPMLRAIGDR